MLYEIYEVTEGEKGPADSFANVAADSAVKAAKLILEATGKKAVAVRAWDSGEIIVWTAEMVGLAA